MDLNHDYNNATDEFLVDFSTQRLQMIKTAILSFGDMGYTDPRVPNILEHLGDYTDEDGAVALEESINKLLVTSCLANQNEIISIKVDRDYLGDNKFVVRMNFTFGSTEVEIDDRLL